jgi:DNA-binding transcriptional ArsR family regulator
MTIAYTDRINTGGNYCGHNPLQPVFTLPAPARKGKGGIPRVLTLCSERLTNYYYNPRKIIPSLDLANGSQRQQRSERRESCIRLMSALLKRVELASLRVGIPTNSGFMSYTVDYITMDTGMNQKRVERALSDLKKAGIVTVSQPREKLPDGSFKGLAAIKTISKNLFGLFGLGVMLKKERDKASKRLREKIHQWEKAKQTLTSRARSALFLNSLISQLKNKPASREKAQAIEYQKKLSLAALELKQQNPTWNSSQCFKEAEQKIGG